MGKSLNCQWMAFAWIWQQIAKQIYFPTSISESWLLRRNQNCKADSSPERTIPPTLPSRSKTIVEKKLGGLPATQDWLERSRQKVQKSETKMQENLYKAERRGTVSDKMVLQLLHLGLDQTDTTVKMWPNSLSGLFRSKNGNVSGRVGTMRDDQDRGDGSHQDHLGLLKVHKESFSSSNILSHLLTVVDVLRRGAS